jgi:hypothetical protein
MSQQPLLNLPKTIDEINAFISLLSNRISEVVSTPPIQQLLNQGQKKGILEAIISLLIIKASHSLSVSGNLKQGQADQIAKQIIADYPLLSIEDINLLLSNGIKGKYGEIYRMDISVIYSWIRSYEEEKAEYIEEKRLLNEKKQVEIKDVAYDPLNDAIINDFLDKLASAGGMRKVPKVTKEELYDDGKMKAKSAGIKFGSQHDNWIRDMKILWAKDNTDLYTGRLIPGAIDFETWLENRK